MVWWVYWAACGPGGRDSLKKKNTDGRGIFKIFFFLEVLIKMVEERNEGRHERRYNYSYIKLKTTKSSLIKKAINVKHLTEDQTNIDIGMIFILNLRLSVQLFFDKINHLALI